MAATVWRGRLAFGLVAIPIRLYKAARRERIRFHRVYRAPAEEVEIQEPPPANSRVRQMPGPALAMPAPEPDSDEVVRVRNRPVMEDTALPVEPPKVLKGYEVEKDRYVTLEPAEIEALRPKTSSELSITEFVGLKEIDPIFFETSYYAVPEAGGEKPYALLFRALSETGYAALGSVAMHGREHVMVIRPGRHGLIVHTLFYQNEVRAEEEYHSDPGTVGEKELEMARMLVSALAAPFDPAKLKDTFEERLQQLIDDRRETAAAARGGTGAPRKPPVVDIMEALKKSLEMARKPPQSEKAEPRTRHRRRRS